VPRAARALRRETQAEPQRPGEQQRIGAGGTERRQRQRGRQQARQVLRPHAARRQEGLGVLARARALSSLVPALTLEPFHWRASAVSLKYGGHGQTHS